MYLDSINKELRKYLMLLCNYDYPEFIEKYINTKDLQRLAGIGQFCGADYTSLYNLRFWYSRLDHSIACALMTWHFTGDKVQTLSALFHDLGTPAFSHCIDFLLGDGANQESSELNVLDILANSDEIKKMLDEDSITDINLLDDHNYSIVENNKPKICVDRLDGVLQTCYTWLQYWNFQTLEKVYKNITILVDEEGNQEIGFLNKEICEIFFDGVFKYSIELQKNKNKYMMNFFSTLFSTFITNKKLSIEDFYHMSEGEILNIIEKDNNHNWNIFTRATDVINTESFPESLYAVSGSTKKRYVNPLCLYEGQMIRLNEISQSCQDLLNCYLNYKESDYCYIDGIRFE